MNLLYHLQRLKQIVNQDIEPQNVVTLPTVTIKRAINMYIIQSFMIALWWCIKDGVVYPWLFFFTTFFQIGWLWNKITDSWKWQTVEVKNPKEKIYYTSLTSIV